MGGSIHLRILWPQKTWILPIPAAPALACFALSTQGRRPSLTNSFSMEFFRSGENRIIFPNQTYPDVENANHSHLQNCLPVRLRNSILGSSLSSYVCPERKIVTYSSRFSCAGRIAFPHIFPWSRPPGKGCVHYTRSLSRIVRLWQPSINAQDAETCFRTVGAFIIPYLPKNDNNIL